MKWENFLEGNVIDYFEILKNNGTLTDKQFNAMKEFWETATKLYPNLLTPAMGRCANEEDYFLDWNFINLPRYCFNITFSPEGNIEWFFRDREKDFCDGNEEWWEKATEEVYELLKIWS